jgi:dihydrofolate reductase
MSFKVAKDRKSAYATDMHRLIAAIDSHRGIADDNGIPWHLPTDQKFFVDQTAEGLILMAAGTYREFTKPMHGRTNYVVTHDTRPLLSGFVAVHDIEGFLKEHASERINNIGGASLFAQTIQFADELVLTQVQQDFHCTKFFPEYEHLFERTSRSEPVIENDVTFWFETWHRKSAND